MSKKKVQDKEKQTDDKIAPGDTIKVHVKIPEEDGKVRIQVFEGILIGTKNSGLSKTITVRRISYGEGVERVFPVHSPTIDKIEIVKKGKVRRAKLYYLRGKKGKKSKIEEKKEAVVQEVLTQ